MIKSDASVNVCSLKHGQGDSFRKLSETRPLPGAEMQQRGMRQMSCDSEAGRVTAIYRSFSGCDVYFKKDRCWIAENNRKELDVILSSGAFFVAAKPSKLSSRKRSALEPNPMSRAEVERATSTTVHAGFWSPWPCGRRHVGRRKTVGAHQNSHGAGDTFSCREKVVQCCGTRALSQVVSMVCCSANSG